MMRDKEPITASELAAVDAASVQRAVGYTTKKSSVSLLHMIGNGIIAPQGFAPVLNPTAKREGTPKKSSNKEKRAARKTKKAAQKVNRR